MRYLIAMIVLCVTASLALAADPLPRDAPAAANPTPVAVPVGALPPAARAALKRAESAAAKVDEEAGRKKAEVTKRLIDDLKGLMRDAMKAENLAEANALQAAITRAEADAAHAVEPTRVFGPPRAEIERVLSADRTWYWHWENRDKRNPFKFAGSPNGLFGTSRHEKDPNPVRFELRWVLFRNDHLMMLIDPNTLRGFFVPTGREVGAFTEEKLPAGR